MRHFPSQGQPSPVHSLGEPGLHAFHGAAHASRRLLSCTLSASGVSGSGCPRGEGAAVTCLQVRRPDGCTDWFLTPSFSSQLLGPEGNPPGGAMCPGLAMEAGLTLAQDPVIGSMSSKWTETYWPCAEGHVPSCAPWRHVLQPQWKSPATRHLEFGPRK